MRQGALVMTRVRLFSILIFLAACPPLTTGGGGSGGGGGTGGGGSGGTGGSGGSGSSDGGTLTLAARTAAVNQTIANNPTCSALPTFYWEIGDVNGALASGTVGTSFNADTQMSIASASKFLWGAYVVERFKDDLSSINVPAMTMRSGYTSLNYDSCLLSATVQACFDAGKNSTYTAANDGKFDYDGGHFQKYAVDLGLGGDDNSALAVELKRLLGSELTFTFGSPQLAGGAKTSASDYARFLRKLLAGTLALAAQLDAEAVCTLPAACPDAVYSPAPLAWHYGYGHWIEDEPGTGDGAFSSPGAYGFYPWIDGTRSYYGILARYSLTPSAYVDSADCGRLLRKAFMTGQAQ
jgi:hypothetical protein